MLTFRDSTQKDFKRIAAFPANASEAFYMFPKGTFPIDPEQLYEVSLTRRVPTVIEYNGEPAGYSNLYDIDEGNSGWLGNVIISSQFRRIGAARFLIQTMMNRAKEELGLRELNLICHNTNTKALLMYNQFGFKPYDLKALKNEEDIEIAGILMKITL
ncbi:N-acetyltransferase [Paenibacillus glycanilyticus]|uniref:N-acetyltransferase n=1 Tax=Paenibacillus glycanilyticus TaxID=126569 RepID=A0ABQ6NPR5_9BACL|nr:GNAT family N-acetyltransferase [Paenibacillus glycanilyticus]GMK45989.1 N-acetyltransferase [Paenibacillus glycanilyticus]